MVPYRIFIADDHMIVRQGLRRIIEETGEYKVIGETGNGLEIASMIRQTGPNLVLLDISMPNLRGIEAVSKIRRISRKIKILILTMHKNEEYVYECLTNGAHGYLLKDDADTELITAINTIQSGKLYVSASFSGDVIRGLIQRKSMKKDGSPFTVLSERERDVLKLLAEGNSSKRTAEKLGLSVRTVEHHRLSIMKKLRLPNFACLIQYAIKAGLIDLS
jgi:DNA-binding NarL/FixJ family response regulator